jgi:hypothetical protein
MKLITNWRVQSLRLDRLLAVGCRYCSSEYGRLTRHDAGAGGEQVWLACCSCGARLGGPLPHIEHRRRSSYPLWSEDLGEALTRQEIQETVLAARPVRLTELLREFPRRRVLGDVHREFSARLRRWQRHC